MKVGRATRRFHRLTPHSKPDNGYEENIGLESTMVWTGLSPLRTELDEDFQGPLIERFGVSAERVRLMSRS